MFSQLVAKPNLIPEWVFCLLAMKASNAAAVVFQAKVSDDILPTDIRGITDFAYWWAKMDLSRRVCSIALTSRTAEA